MNCLIHLTGMFKNINYFLTDSAENVLADNKLMPDPGEIQGLRKVLFFSTVK